MPCHLSKVFNLDQFSIPYFFIENSIMEIVAVSIEETENLAL